MLYNPHKAFHWHCLSVAHSQGHPEYIVTQSYQLTNKSNKNLNPGMFGPCTEAQATLEAQCLHSLSFRRTLTLVSRSPFRLSAPSVPCFFLPASLSCLVPVFPTNQQSLTNNDTSGDSSLVVVWLDDPLLRRPALNLLSWVPWTHRLASSRL